jgi:hypothetical protein
VIQTDADRLKLYDRLAEICWLWKLTHGYSREHGNKIVPSFTVYDRFGSSSEVTVVVRDSNIEMLNQAMVDGREEWGVLLWVCRCRRERPVSGPPASDARLAAMFAAVEDMPPVTPFLNDLPSRSQKWPAVEPYLAHPGQHFGNYIKQPFIARVPIKQDPDEVND